MIETGWATRLASRFDDEAGYRRNPVGWMRAKPHEEPWSTQREILDSIVVNRSTAVTRTCWPMWCVPMRISCARQQLTARRRRRLRC
jgi:hypothetical protein